ncbi:MAG: hypothetical protein AAF394_08880 [Planctomycetota bacterium]
MQKVLLLTVLCAASSAIGQESKLEFKAFSQLSTASSYGWSTVENGLPQNIPKADLLAGIRDADDFLFLGATTFGDERSRSIAVGIRPAAEGKLELWVDLDRDGRFDAEECIRQAESSASLPLWSVELPAEYLYSPQGLSAEERAALREVKKISVGGQELPAKYQAYPVEFKFDELRPSVAMRTCGRMQGTANFRGEARLAQIEDRDANGRWFDAEDRIFVDLNGDGKLSRLSERISAQGIKKVRGTLTAIEGSMLGTSLRLREITDQGWLVPSLKLAGGSTEVTKLSAVLTSTAGVQFKITSVEQPLQVPIGDYFVRDIDLTLRSSDQEYRFVFTENGNATKVQVRADSQHPIQILGDLRLGASVAMTRGGDGLRLVTTPYLNSSSGLYLVLASSGIPGALVENRLQCATTSKEKLIGVGSSGFS